MAGFKSALLTGLIGRLYYLQGIKVEEYKTFSDSNRIKLQLLPPLRGKIFDKKGLLLAGNRNFYRVILDPEYSKNTKETLEKLATVLKMDDVKRESMMKKYKNHNSKRVLILYEQLSWEEVAAVEVNSTDLPGVSIDVGRMRDFPMGEISPHLIGYLGPVSEEEIKVNPLLNHPDFKIGRSGIEKAEEDALRGKVGVRRMEVNAFGLSVRELSREDSLPGDDINLTIDKQLQEFAGERMKDISGSAIVIDLQNSGILSFISSPGFDPNKFTYGVPAEYWKELNANLDKPLINKAISNQYPPGSTFKPVVALAALKAGVNPETKVYCPGYVYLGNHKFRCWKDGGHGHLDMEGAIMHSCNAYFYTVAKKIGIDAIADMARRFGFGAETGIIISGEKTGNVPDEKWKMKKFKQVWQAGDTLNIGIGQGYMLVTPLQLAVMAAKIATGKEIKPLLVKDKELQNSRASLNIPEAHMKIVQEGMRHVMNTPGGTAFGSRIEDEDFQMAGKTGTVQVISKKALEKYKYKMTEEELARTKNHALFVGYAPCDNPRYAIAVVVEHGGSGSGAAAPVARDIMKKAKELEAI